MYEFQGCFDPGRKDGCNAWASDQRWENGKQVLLSDQLDVEVRLMGSLVQLHSRNRSWVLLF